MSSALILSVIVLLSSCCEGHKILIYSPKLFGGHVGFMGRIADILVGAGHEVVVLMPECDGRLKTNGTQLARVMRTNCSFDGLREMLSFLDDIWPINGLLTDAELIGRLKKEHFDLGISEVFSSCGFGIFEKIGLQKHLSAFNTEIIEMYDSDKKILNSNCGGLLTDAELIGRLKKEHFDLGISEVFSSCGFGIFEKIGLQKHLSAFNTEIFEAITEPFGISYNPSYVPGKALLSYSNDMMSFMERVKNFVLFLNTYVIIRFMAVPHVLQPFEEHIRQPFTIVESFETLSKCPSIFINANLLLEFPREVNSRIAFVGGLTASRSGSLTEITFIWKYELDDEVASDLPNVVKRKWIPQAGLLGHRNMRAFVSQCGANGMGESVYAGVPMVCIPLFFDQMRVAKKVEKQRIAVVIHKQNFTAKSFQWALRTVVYDKSYSVSARRMSAVTKDIIIPMEEEISRRARIAIKMKKVELLDAGYRKLNCLKFFYIDVICIPLILIILLS
ncbi:Putative UDP-glucuronosyltransferase ugt-50 [Toxocara canis]|uniref:UDP-glucuronosyltransferase n=1 Tax=Toxocara canis TaxID=6265 RepID=A0A0B2W4F1_TOXCA|nr:Putative UDP-glucuronosyltransferase ugt-50 [Toxocara canis]